MKSLEIFCVGIVILFLVGCREGEKITHTPLPAHVLAPAGVDGYIFHATITGGSGVFTRSGGFVVQYTADAYTITGDMIRNAGKYGYRADGDIGTMITSDGHGLDQVLKIAYTFTTTNTGTYLASSGTSSQNGTFYMVMTIPKWRWLRQ